MAAPRVTLAVPVYNGAAYLATTLDSLLAQDFGDLEVVVSDNASTDGTPDICTEYAATDPRVRCVRNERNLGAAANYNRLVALARGSYFKWASADDLCAPSLVSRCVEILDTHPDVILAYPKTVMIDERGKRLRDHEDGLHMLQPEAWKRLEHFARYRWLCNPCFGLMRTDVLRRTRLVRPNPHSDISLLGELTIAGKFYEVPERLFFRRVTATSCGLGKLSENEVAAWFQPNRAGPGFIESRRLVFLQIQRSIATAPMPLLSRIRCMWAFWRASKEKNTPGSAHVHGSGLKTAPPATPLSR